MAGHACEPIMLGIPRSSSFNSNSKIIQRIGSTEFSSGAGSTAGLQRRRGGNQQDQQADR